MALDPYYIEATANRGQTYEKESKWDKVLDAYRQALALNKDDVLSAALAKRAQSIVALQNDVVKMRRMDSLVKRLTAQYRSPQESTPKEEDSWTSRPMVVSLMDFQEKGGLSKRELPCMQNQMS